MTNWLTLNLTGESPRSRNPVYSIVVVHPLAFRTETMVGTATRARTEAAVFNGAPEDREEALNGFTLYWFENAKSLVPRLAGRTGSAEAVLTFVPGTLADLKERLGIRRPFSDMRDGVTAKRIAAALIDHHLSGYAENADEWNRDVDLDPREWFEVSQQMKKILAPFIRRLDGLTENPQDDATGVVSAHSEDWSLDGEAS